MIIGSRLKISNGFPNTLKTMLDINANASMVYTRLPNGFHYEPMSDYNLEESKEFAEDKNIDLYNIVVHAPYTLNLSSPNESKRDNGIKQIINEIARASALGSRLLVVQPGSSTKGCPDKAIVDLADSLNKIINNTKDYNVTICIKQMSGQGDETCTNFSQLARVLNLVDKQDKVGICLDTGRMHSYGYDLENNLNEIINEFDELIGLDKLKVVLLNGASNIKGDPVYNLTNIADSTNIIGLEPLLKLCNEPRIKDNAILILETGNRKSFQENIKLIKEYNKKEN